ncbi:MFS transporter [Paracoccus onubensis]|uniref:MFS transporter n=1 Tax=Paracoccus onubensis TaxID=1675788 RepID=UPI00272FDD04|nr:MFS transporter [Paracoccus onubensis]MDP0929758.1 MFS transporter [Paracoccus onubensis]
MERKPDLSDKAEQRQGMTAPGWALAALAISMLLSSLGISIPNVALPSLAQGFDAGFPQVQWVVLSYLLAITVLTVSAGRLGDLAGHRRVLTWGIGVFTLASALCAIAPTLPLLIAARVLQGAAGSILMGLTVALVRSSVPKKRTGSAMGLLGTMSAIGTALGPSLGGILISGFGWRAIFAVMVPMGFAALALARRYLPPDAQGGRVDHRAFDKPGMLVLGLALAAYALAVTADSGALHRQNLILLIMSALGAAAFVMIERRATAPLIHLSVFRDKRLNASLIMSALVSTIMMATLVVGPFYLARALGHPPAIVGLIMSVGPAISALSGVPAGRLVDRLGAGTVVIWGLGQMALGAFALASLPNLIGTPGYVIALAILTPGYQLFQAANNTVVMMDVSQERRGVISGVLGLSRNLGLITGASAMGAAFTIATGSADLSAAGAQAISRGMGVTFAVAGGLAILSLVIALSSGMRTQQADHTIAPQRQGGNS